MQSRRCPDLSVSPPGCGATQNALDFIGWLRSYNDSLPASTATTGFYGLDLYSLHASIEAVLNYLDKVDPEGARGLALATRVLSILVGTLRNMVTPPDSG